MNFLKPKFWDKDQISFFSILLFPITFLIKFLFFLKCKLSKTHTCNFYLQTNKQLPEHVKELLDKI